MKRILGIELVEVQAFWAVVLILTGFMKLSFNASNPPPFLGHHFFWVLGGFEVAIGLLFLFSAPSLKLAALGFAMFCGFLCVSIVQAVGKTPSCGCMGPVKFPPQLMAFVDLIGATSFGFFLITWRKGNKETATEVRGVPPVAHALRVSGVCLAGFFVFSGLWFGTFEAPANILKREEVLVTSALTQPIHSHATVVEAELRVTNLSSSVLEIASLSTVKPFELIYDADADLSVQAFGQATIPVTLRIRKTELKSEERLKPFVGSAALDDIDIPQILKNVRWNGIPVFILTNANLEKSKPHIIVTN